ncbi:hypothetical protein EVAR_31098_1 [Eumeta japonica]|uniref:Uncharacterized protein n=1 Tax=Eumeta variegata TaxID=151549 RepID=A0A4C1VDF6_EUMVA|nr:hypothetical protein EVAR_31098_1 [Eumeta japonica]
MRGFNARRSILLLPYQFYAIATLSRLTSQRQSFCAAGRAAWQEAAVLAVGGGGAGAGGAARRCSVLGDHPHARKDHHWPRNNRVRDASCGSSSESSWSTRGEGGAAARLLYAGLGTLALGLVVYFVGTGDKGFKTPALRLVGPSLIVAGLACCVLRVALCVCARPCCRRRSTFKENRRFARRHTKPHTDL